MSPTLPILAAFALTASAAAGTVSLAPAQDGTLFEDSLGSIANGAGEWLFAGTTAMESRRRTLLRFDLAAAGIPADAVITDVRLTLTMDRGATSALFMSLHRVTSDWGEGASIGFGQQGAGGPAAPGDATWIHRRFPESDSGPPAPLWTTPGGDFADTPSALLAAAGPGPLTWSGPGLITDVQAMLDSPAANFGWLLLGDESSTPPTAKRFFSREVSDPALRPALAITYVPGPSAGACALVVLMALNTRTRRRGLRH